MVRRKERNAEETALRPSNATVFMNRATKPLRILNSLAYLYAEHFPGKMDRAIELAKKR